MPTTLENWNPGKKQDRHPEDQGHQVARDGPQACRKAQTLPPADKRVGQHQPRLATHQDGG